jgi:hypothetical protein
MPKLPRKQLVRLLAEAYAQLEPQQIDAMAESMSLEPVDVQEDLEKNEREYEALKDAMALS